MQRLEDMAMVQNELNGLEQIGINRVEQVHHLLLAL